MNLHTRFSAPVVALLALLPLVACDGPTGSQFAPLMARDTIVVSAPTPGETVATAFDVMVVSLFVGGPRHPERAEHTDQWDIAVREREGVLQFVPAGALGSVFRPGITAPITGTDFDALSEAPQSGYVTDAGVPIQEGALYVVRSREGTGFGACIQYSKLEVVSVETDPVRVTLRLATNANCYDLRIPTSAS
jgi:hypothetical protein